MTSKKVLKCRFCNEPLACSFREHLADCVCEPVCVVAEEPFTVALGSIKRTFDFADTDTVQLAVTLSACVWELQRRWPSTRFQYIPLEMVRVGNTVLTTTLLAIAEPDRERGAYREAIA